MLRRIPAFGNALIDHCSEQDETDRQKQQIDERVEQRKHPELPPAGAPAEIDVITHTFEPPFHRTRGFVFNRCRPAADLRRGPEPSGFIPAKVEIVISTKDNVFTVPRDAVGTNDDGSTYVLRKTGGEGVDMTFEQVAVTEGDTNDYYVEITGSDLNEGDVIRATADLTQGIESGTSDSDVQMMENGDLYVGDGSNMPEGTVVMGGPGGGPGGPGGQ